MSSTSQTSRPIEFWESLLIKGNSPIILAIKFDGIESTEKAVSILVRSVPAFNLKIIDDKIVSVKTPPEIIDLPKEHINSCEDAIKWMAEQDPIDATQRLGKIARRNDMLVISVSHSVADGPSAAFWVSHCLDDTFGPSPLLPISMGDYFKELAKKSSHDFPLYIDCATIHYKKPSGEDQNSQKILPWSIIEIPLEKLKGYDAQLLANQDKITEKIWVALILAISSYNGKFDRIGCVTTVDLRKFIENPLDLSFALCTSGLAVSVNKEINLDSSIEELEKCMRDKYNHLIEAGVHYARLDFESHFEPSDGPVADIANLGSVVLDKHIDDFAISFSIESAPNNEFYNMSYTKVQGDKATFFMRTSYVPNKLQAHEIESLHKKIEYVITSVDSKMIIKDVLKAIENL